MNWPCARERLGAELIGGREQVASHWRGLCQARGLVPHCLDVAAVELVLQSGASLADGSTPETPWVRCGAMLRVDASAGERALALELQTLWQAIESEVRRLSFGEEEERAACDALELQLDAALRGATAEVRELLEGESVESPVLRYGGIKLLCHAGATPAPEVRAA